ncbi:hypothetical protein I5Q34_27665 [Streptomyces sp. AV19]|uniref:DNA primase family protein n=1 Tax=Streptomyces sp. AV19 TaxID=2793068 RepID=UPI0018FE7428|nr:phage/plasmid primase, P4 family [Streptomyces sp. AV19]MBH1938004.1 hypothetical protein [Streptomyces sp. AV19]MDG4536619.1 phage/plasmid primase, P4 family [Streptomyces sp. AV19]
MDYAEFVAEQSAGRLKFVPELGWLTFSGKVWETGHKDDPALQACTEASLRLFKEAGNGSMWAAGAALELRRTFNRTHIARELRALPRMTARVEDVDGASHLVAFQNGTVDLRTGELRPHDPADLITQAAPIDYRPDAECPTWERFLAEVFPRTPDVIPYMQTLLGYGISGENREHAFAVWFGDKGRNGKGTIMRAMKATFGTGLVRDVAFSVFEKNSGAHTEDMARLYGARIVTASEGSEGVPMDDEMLKRHAGGDSITARHLYAKTFEYVPRYLIVLQSNYLPEFRSAGNAIWARVRAVEFTETFMGREDRGLDASLTAEAEGIAAWVIRGAVRYYSEGLRSPESVEATTREHREKVNPLAPLIDDLFTFDSEAKTKRSDFNRELKDWKQQNGLATNRFTPQFVKFRLHENGCEEVKVQGTKFLRGIRLMPEYGGPVQVPDTPAGISGPGIFSE